MAEAVSRGSLSFGPLLAQGGQGRVFELETGAGTSGAVPRVAKLYADDALVSPASLGAIVKAPTLLAAGDEAALRESTAWPLQVIEENGRAVGIVMERVRDEFWHDIAAPNSVKRAPREAAWLFDDRGRAARCSVDDPSDDDRRALCSVLANVLAILHDNDLVYGDLSARNVLWTIRPRPAVLLLDCDGVRRVGRAAPSRQLDSPDWGDGSATNQTVDSDRYKFGLFVARIFARSLTSRDGQPAAAALGESGGRLLARALSTTPAERPSMHEWRPVLDGGRRSDAGRPDDGSLPGPEQWSKGADGRWTRGPAGARTSDLSTESPGASASGKKLAWVKGPNGWVTQAVDLS